MGRHETIQNAYRTLGEEASFYDGMITCATLMGRVVCALVWDMDREDNTRYLEQALSGIGQDFSGRLLEVPVGTGVLTMPLYQTLPKADITCLDYSMDMMDRARCRAEAMGLSNVSFQQGDVGSLPFEEASFDTVLSLNGLHAFPDKQAAFQETFRVLKPGGVFCGCCYVRGEIRRTDWLIDQLYVPRGFFTPPFETADSLRRRLEELYVHVEVTAVKSMACFTCRKGA